jgi:hypothetical protein
MSNCTHHPPLAVSVNLSINPSNTGSGTIAESSRSRKAARGFFEGLDSVFLAV